MRKIVFSLLLLLSCVVCGADGYNDHRGRNVDSLERVVARWDAVSIESASMDELMQLCVDWRSLMKGYKQTNAVKNDYYARKVLELGRRLDWKLSIWDAAKDIGETFWAREMYDSASCYFGIAIAAIEQMEVAPDGQEVRGESYSQLEKDDCLSSLYGAIGNLYSMQDSISTAMDYYGKALDIFKEYGWDTSCSVCYFNMGETILGVGDQRAAKEYYQKSLDYARQANDSLWIATALKGFGNLYLAQGKTRKALRCLEQADNYYSLHEDEELFARMETLDFTSQVLKLQKRSLVWWLIALAGCLCLALALVAMYHRLRVARKEQHETAAVLDETLDELGTEAEKIDFKLNDREIDILKLLSQGMTTPMIADKMCLSPETIKWYRKKLFVKFDAASAAELVKKALELKVI